MVNANEREYKLPLLDSVGMKNLGQNTLRG